MYVYKSLLCLASLGSPSYDYSCFAIRHRQIKRFYASLRSAILLMTTLATQFGIGFKQKEVNYVILC